MLPLKIRKTTQKGNTRGPESLIPGPTSSPKSYFGWIMAFNLGLFLFDGLSVVSLRTCLFDCPLDYLSVCYCVKLRIIENESNKQINKQTNKQSDEAFFPKTVKSINQSINLVCFFTFLHVNFDNFLVFHIFTCTFWSFWCIYT